MHQLYCLFVFLSFCLFVFLSFCLFVFLSFCLSGWLAGCMYVYMSVSMCVCVCVFMNVGNDCATSRPPFLGSGNLTTAQISDLVPKTI